MSMTHDELIAVLQAAKVGKTIECRLRESGGQWEQKADTLHWDTYKWDYRVKPGLIELYVNIYESGKVGGAWKQRESAQQAAEICEGSYRTIKLREVLE